MMPDRIFDKLPPGITGWALAVVIALIFFFKYGATWIRAFSETRNSETATLFTGLKLRLDDLNDEVNRKELAIQRLVEEQNNCKKDSKILQAEINELRLKVLHLEEFKISHQHSRSTDN